MLIHKKGNILEATEDIIAHQCNTEGIFGGGLALQIKEKFSSVEPKVKSYAEENKDNLIGTYFVSGIHEYNCPIRFVINCFSQNEDYTTNYEAIREIFDQVLTKTKNMYSLAIPKNYGCGIAKGNWEEVEQIFTELSEKHGVNIAVYELEVTDNE